MNRSKRSAGSQNRELEHRPSLLLRGSTEIEHAEILTRSADRPMVSF